MLNATFGAAPLLALALLLFPLISNATAASTPLLALSGVAFAADSSIVPSDVDDDVPSDGRRVRNRGVTYGSTLPTAPYEGSASPVSVTIESLRLSIISRCAGGLEQIRAKKKKNISRYSSFIFLCEIFFYMTENFTI